MEFIPIPRVALGKVIGLLEVLDDLGGRENGFRLAVSLQIEFGELILVIKAAEMLDLVQTPGTEVVLTGRGKELLLQDINGRKKIVKRQLLRLPTFRLIVDILKAQPERKMPYDTIVDVLVTHLPEEDPGRLARAIIDWGRFGELVGYNSRTGTVYLDQEE